MALRAPLSTDISLHVHPKDASPWDQTRPESSGCKNEKRFGQLMNGDILRMRRSSSPAGSRTSDNDAESCENAGAEKRGFAISSMSEENDLANSLMDVAQVAEYLSAS